MTNEKLIKLLQEIYPNEKIHISRPTCDPMSFSQNVIARIGQLGYLKFDVESFVDCLNSGDISYEQVKEELKGFTLNQVEKPSTMWHLFDPLTPEETSSLNSGDVEKGYIGCIRIYSKDELEQMGYEVESVPVILHEGIALAASSYKFETLKEFHQFMDTAKTKKVLALFQNLDRTYTARIFNGVVAKKSEMEFLEKGVDVVQDDILNKMSQEQKVVRVDVGNMSKPEAEACLKKIFADTDKANGTNWQ